MRLYILFIFLILNTSQAQISGLLEQKMKQGGIFPVLIQMKDQAKFPDWKASWTKEEKASYVYTSLKQTALNSQNRLLQYMADNKLKHRSHYVVNMVWAELNTAQIMELSGWPEIEKIMFDAQQKMDLPSADLGPALEARGPEITWGLSRIGADKVWDMGFKGQGVVVAGEDTGIRWDLPDFKERYLGYNKGNVDHNYAWHDAIHSISPLSGNPNNPCGLETKVPCDDHGHGTHTVGTMVGLTNERAIGVAPEANWIGCRNMERGNGAPSTYIECFEFFLAPFNLEGKDARPEKAPHVINNSWYCSLEEGCDTSTFPIMELVIENLRKSGVVVVVSAGNDGASCSTLNHIPAIYEGSFSVGANQSNDMISGFSSNGPVINYKEIRIKPNVVAPGSDVLSILPDGSYQSWSGTSMAGPHVAGLVALIISANPKLAGQVDKIEDIIMETATPLTANFDCWPYSGNKIPNNTYGFGLINAEKAVKRALLISATEDQQAQAISFFPNPAKEGLTVHRAKGSSEQILIKDALGKTVREYFCNENPCHIELGALTPGFYFISQPNTIEQALVIIP